MALYTDNVKASRCLPVRKAKCSIDGMDGWMDGWIPSVETHNVETKESAIMYFTT